jgi:hypothetical protein
MPAAISICRAGSLSPVTDMPSLRHLDEFRHFPLPAWFFHPAVLKLGGWSALALELSLGVLIWVKEFRYVLLALGLLFHLCLEYSLNIPLFQWDILSAYILFIDGDDLSDFLFNLRRRVFDWFPASRSDSCA